MGLIQYTTLAKLAFAEGLWRKKMEFLTPPIPVSSWVDAIAENHGMAMNGAGWLFENVYRCYHHSFKVVSMQQHVEFFLSLLVFLFNQKITDDTIAEIDNHGLLRAMEIAFGDHDHLNHLGNIFRQDSLSYQYAKDILERKPVVKGMQCWEMHHVALMGGTLWVIIAGSSLLGMLKWASKNRGTQLEGLITYPEGVADYLSTDINISGLNS